jgi:AraC-like DNA-binding protein
MSSDQSKPRSEPAAISTVLSADERLRVDAAGDGCYRTMHRDSFDAVLRDLRERRASAVVVSLAQCDGASPLALARLVREFPRVPAVALLSTLDARAAQAALALGRSGVSRLVDVRTPQGWRELRTVLANARGSDAERQMLALCADVLAAAPEECRRFFDALVIGSARHSTVRAITARLHIRASTLMSRFFRAGLPAPKRYLAYARLVRAAYLCENPGLSVANVALHLEYSSAQSFNRHVQAMLGITAHRFRVTHDGAAMLARFRDELFVPNRTALEALHPLGVALAGLSERRVARPAA